MAQGELAAEPGTMRGLAEVAARIDRLPLTRVQWELAIWTQIAWGFIIVDTDGVAARLYPFVWKPQHLISSFEYSTIYAIEVGFGILIGDYLMGLAADRFGRRPALAGAVLLGGIFLWPFAVLTNFWGLFIISFFVTLGTGAILSVHAVYSSEITSPRVRSKVLLSSQGVTALCSVAVGIMAFYWIPSHYKLYLWILTASLIALAPILYWRCPESPRWLESHGRHEEARRGLEAIERRVSRYAGPLPPADATNYPLISTASVPFYEVLTNREYLPRTLVMFTAWFLGYAGIIYGVGAFRIVYWVDHGAGSHYVFLLGIVISIFSFILFQIMGHVVGERFERRDVCLFFAIVFTVCMFAMYAWPNKVIFDTFGLVAAISASQWLFNMYNYTAVSYPTRIRSAGVGMSDGVGHIGAWAGGQIASTFYAMGPNHLGWFLMVTIPGALVPALLIRLAGIKQREAVLEQVST